MKLFYVQFNKTRFSEHHEITYQFLQGIKTEKNELYVIKSRGVFQGFKYSNKNQFINLYGMDCTDFFIEIT